MKPLRLTIVVALLTAGYLSATTAPFQESLSFNRSMSPKPYTGMDLLRLDNPFILVQHLTNSTNPILFNRNKYLSIRYGNNTGLFSKVAQYNYDSISKKWDIAYFDEYTFVYNYGTKLVNQARVSKHFEDENFDRTMKTDFSFNGFNVPDTQWIYRVTQIGTSLASRIVFTYDQPWHLVSTRTDKADNSIEFSKFSYDSLSRLAGELKLRTSDGISPVDSLSRQTYTYDSTGKLSAWQEEQYGLPGRTGKWTIINRVTYTYDNKDRLASDRSYILDSAYNLNLDILHLYSYNDYDKLETLIEMKQLKNGNFFPNNKLVIFYDVSHHATYGYSYPWAETDYSRRASDYYTFAQDDKTDIDHVTLQGMDALVYPNPASDELQLTGKLCEAPISVIDANGKLVMSVNNVDHSKINIAGLAPGVYTIISSGLEPIRFIKT